MKCSTCGYKHDPKPEPLENGFIIYANEPFKQYQFFDTFTTMEVNLYACPKCGSVKIEK